MEMPPVQFPLRSRTCPSGLRVRVGRDSRTRLAGVFLVVGAGSTSDPAGKEGLAHYIEHLAFRSRPGGGPPLHTLLQSAGAFSANAETGFDLTVYYELGLASELHDLLQVEGARMLAPVVGVPDPVRATELDIVKNELRERNETGFIGEVLTEMQAAVFPGDHPYHRPLIGPLRSLDPLRAAGPARYAA